MDSISTVRTGRRAVLGMALAGAGTALLPRRGRAADPVRIGYSIARTGYLGVATPVAENAYILWKEQVNAAGGLDVAGEKRMIEFVAYDDQSDPTTAAQIYERLISQDKVDLLLSPYATPLHIGIAPVIERYGFPLVGSSAGSTLLRDLGAKHMWFCLPLSDDYGPALAEFVQAEGMQSIALLTLQLPFSLEVKQFAMPLFEKAGIKVLVDEEYPPDIRDMTAMLSKVKSAKPDAIIALSYPGNSILYVNQARELGIEAKMQFLFIGPSGEYFAKLFPPQAVNGLTTVSQWAPSQSQWPGAKPFYDAYKARFGEAPDYVDTVIHYMSAEVLQQAVAKVGLDRGALTETINTMTFETVGGPVKFDGVHNATTPAGFVQYQEGQMEIVWPEKIATSAFVPGWKPA